MSRAVEAPVYELDGDEPLSLRPRGGRKFEVRETAQTAVTRQSSVGAVRGYNKSETPQKTLARPLARALCDSHPTQAATIMATTFFIFAMFVACACAVSGFSQPFQPHSISEATAAPPAFDCALRSLVYNQSLSLLPPSSNAAAVFSALQLSQCQLPPPSPQRSSLCNDFDPPKKLQFHVSPEGSDDNGGSAAHPFASLHRAQREVRRSGQQCDVLLHAGTHRLTKPLILTAEDSWTRYTAACRGGPPVVISGAASLSLTFTRTGGALWSASTPTWLRGADQLFIDGASGVGERLVWAREPNGNAEVDLQPIGYAPAQDNPLGDKPPPAAAGPWTALRTPVPKRNSTSFPGFGFDNDPRRPNGYVSLHRGSYAGLYEGGRDFWNQTFPAGLRWNATPGERHGFNLSVFNASGWPESFRQKPLLHAMHHSEWGNHVWEVDALDTPKRTFTLGRGGWQEARYIAIANNPFYVEGAKAALDTPGEWYHDEAEKTLYLIPNATIPQNTHSLVLHVSIPQLTTLVNVSGTPDDPVRHVSFEGITFTHTRRTLLDAYVVPSAGDWSVRGSGALTVSMASDVSIDGCAFNRTGGSAVVLRGGVLRASVARSDFELLGDSGVVLIGELPGLGNNGSDAVWPRRNGSDEFFPTYPRDTTIVSNHFHGLGVWQKQSAALFQALSCRTNFSSNVAYNGPRAAININDGFCGSLRLESNVLFNWVRETQDHGPINTWDRQAYVQPDGGLYQAWSYVTHNLIMNGPSGNRDLGNLFPAVDNDDGSAFYWIASNVVAYGGFKNFLGNDKVWTANLVIYPNGRTAGSGNGPCVMAWGGQNEIYENNTCVTRDAAGPGVDPYPWAAEGGGCDYANATMRPVLVHLARNAYLSKQATYAGACGHDLDGLSKLGEEVGSRVGAEPSVEQLMAMANRTLATTSPAQTSLNGLTLTIYNNTALSGTPLSSSVVPSPAATHGARKPFSALLTGTLHVERGFIYNFSCDFGGAVLGYAHIDGHLVCQTGTNHKHKPTPPSVRSTTYDTPLPVLAATSLAVRFALVHNGSPAVDVADLSFGMTITRWTAEASATDAGDEPDWLSAALSPTLSAEEQQRDTLQSSLASGWGAWYDMSFTKLVRLPEGSTLSLMLCEPTSNSTAPKCATETRTDWPSADSKDVQLRPGAHAYDRSYAQLYAATPTCNVSIAFGGGDQLLVEVEVVSGCNHTQLVLVGGTAWYRMHAIATTTSSITMAPYGTGGLKTSLLHATTAARNCGLLPATIAAQPHLCMPLKIGTTIGVASEAPLSAAEISARLQTAWLAEQERYSKFGDLAEAKMGVQAGVMWNVVYNPLETVIAPVIRGNPWTWDEGAANDDWPYVLFDWDTHFAAYMLSLDAKALSYSVLIQVVKAKTAKGFVPNGAAPTRKSTHSQPPVGSKVLLELYRRYGDAWLVRLLFDDLLDWSNWWLTNRKLAPLNLTALGGDDMQAARYESGLDNSPMYDGEFFAVTQPDGYGLMTMYDVGMASIVAMSDESLATLAGAIGRDSDAKMLHTRAAEERRKIEAHLWDADLSIYSNRRQNGSFYPRISPTSFYPMLAGAAAADRATEMISKWMLNASHFCVSTAGDFQGNSDDCYWGLPSINAADSAFPRLGYWRGFVWGPMALLTYWGLAHPAYATVPIVSTARAALCKQMRALFLSQWRRHRHVCENFSPKKDATECTGMHFYHWGGLTALIGLLEAGY